MCNGKGFFARSDKHIEKLLSNSVANRFGFSGLQLYYFG